MFVAFSAPDAPGLLAWASFRDSVVHRRGGEPPQPATDVPEVGIWRLLASNNREVGRSAQLFATFDEARDAILSVQARASELQLEVFHGPMSATHGWAAILDDTPVFTCSRWYETGPICAEVAATSLQSFARARVIQAPQRVAALARRTRLSVLPL